jgi:hypothetical protein
VIVRELQDVPGAVDVAAALDAERRAGAGEVGFLQVEAARGDASRPAQPRALDTRRRC